MAAIREATVEHFPLETPRDGRLITTAPSGMAAPVSPFASVMRSGRPASP